MTKFQDDTILDNGTLKYLRERVTRITICSSSPSSFSDANSTTGVMLGKTTQLTSTDFTLADSGGRKIVSPAQTITMDATGTMKNAAWIGTTTSTVYLVTDITSQSVTAGKGITLPAHDFQMSDVLPYKDLVLSIATTDMFCYYPMDETSGGTADNYEGNADLDSPYTGGYTLNDGQGVYDNGAVTFSTTASSCIDLKEVELNNLGTFDGREVSWMCWFKVQDASTWTDATVRTVFSFRTDASNRFYVSKSNTSNRIDCYYLAGGSTKTGNSTAQGGNTDWIQVIGTVSLSNDRYKWFLNGTEIAEYNSLGTWIDPPTIIDNQTIIGSRSKFNLDPWKGWIKHVAFWNTELTTDQVTTLWNGGPA